MEKKNKFAELAQSQLEEKRIIQSENNEDILDATVRENLRILELTISDINENPYQPRKFFDDEKQKELTESIKTYGQLNPVLVKKDDNGKYYLVAGERRLKACNALNFESIKAIVINADPEIVSLIDNIQREDLHPVERAIAVSKLYEKYNRNKKKVAEVISVSERTVERLIKLSSLKENIYSEDYTDSESRLTNNRIPIREFYDLLRIEDKEELNKKLKVLEKKYNKEPEIELKQRKAKRIKDDMDKIIEHVDKIIKELNNIAIDRNDPRVLELLEKIRTIEKNLNS